MISKHNNLDTLFFENIFKSLNLEIVPHHKPYPLGWVCENMQLQVTRKCKMKFAITTNFIDEVELDVVLLDICGIVLGSPYLYDKKVIFHRHEKNIIYSKVE